MKRIYNLSLAAVILLGASLAFVSCKKNNANPSNLGIITGKIAPAAAVTMVTARDTSNASSVYTVVPNAAGGEFDIFDVKPGTYQIILTTAPGFTAPTGLKAKIVGGNTADLGTITVPSSNVGNIKGVISPVGAVIKITATTVGRSLIANPLPGTGQFQFLNLAPGAYTLAFTSVNGYQVPANRNVNVVAGQTLTLDTVKVVGNTGDLTGIIWPPNGVSRITLTRAGAAPFTNPTPVTGQFRFQNLTAGSYVMSFSANLGFQTPANRNVTIIPGQVMSVDTIRVLPNTGIVTGSINPASTVTKVTLTSSTAVDYSAVPDPANGQFRIPNLQPGDYRASFTTSTGYAPPASRKVTVTAAQTTDMGRITALSSGFPAAGNGTLQFKVNNVLTTATAISAVRSSGNLILTAMVSSTQMITMVLPGAIAIQNYPLSGATANGGYGNVFRFGGSWSTSLAGGGGRAAITAYDPVNRKISGTFTLSPAVPANRTASSSGPLSITNGTFTDVVFQ